MAKARTTFLCRSCGNVQHRWMGRCPDCGAWDSLEEHRVEAAAERDPQRGGAGAWTAEAGGKAPVAEPLSRVGDGAQPAERIGTGSPEFDRALGGGLVKGSVVLLGGDPGIGKSTLLLQAAGAMAASGTRVLYVSSEESGEQIRLRAGRLGVDSGGDDLFVLADTNLARILEQARKVRPGALVLDSVQMIYKADVEASPGSVAQLRRCCLELVYLAKSSGMALVLIGHVTKEGALAGPRLIEHMVDAVLYFEGERSHAHRVVRSVKNRFGATLEVGLFEMTGAGLRDVTDAAGVAALVDEPRAGSVVFPALTGSRCVLVELQALCATGFPGSAKRKASGVDANRLAMLIAVLEQHAGLRLADRDIFVSAVGGMRVVEPASDLALALAIAGAHHRRALAPGTAAVGEVGLGGELRQVAQTEARVREAARLGYRRVIVPRRRGGEAVKVRGVEFVEAPALGRAIEELG